MPSILAGTDLLNFNSNVFKYDTCVSYISIYPNANINIPMVGNTPSIVLKKPTSISINPCVGHFI